MLKVIGRLLDGGTAWLLRIVQVRERCRLCLECWKLKDATLVVIHSEKYQKCLSRLGAPCICCAEETERRCEAGLFDNIEHQDWYSVVYLNLESQDIMEGNVARLKDEA